MFVAVFHIGGQVLLKLAHAVNLSGHSVRTVGYQGVRGVMDFLNP